jgi:hypothetical protein
MKMHVVSVIAAASLAALLLGAAPIVVVSVAHSNLNGLAFGVTLALLVASVLLGIAAWIGGLIQAAAAAAGTGSWRCCSWARPRLWRRTSLSLRRDT